MNETVGALLNQGLIMTALGMGLVFAALALLWGLMRLLTTVFRDKGEVVVGEAVTQPVAAALSDTTQGEQLTAERAHVAAIVAGALLSNALWLEFEPPVGPTFEHGRTAPAWVAGNRSHALQRWQPQRKPENYPPSNQY